jgi:AcrR family transcriptional regulator
MPRPNRWNDVVEAAAKTFLKNGFSSTSIEQIATELGMLKGSIYHYVQSKEDLLFAVVREPAERLLADVESLQTIDLPASAKLRRAARSHALVLEEHGIYAAVYLQEIAGKGRYEEWKAMDRRYLGCVEAVFAAGRESGEFDSQINERLSALAFIGALNWMTHWLQADGPLPATAVADRFVDLFLVGLLTRI